MREYHLECEAPRTSTRCRLEVWADGPDHARYLAQKAGYVPGRIIFPLPPPEPWQVDYKIPAATAPASDAERAHWVASLDAGALRDVLVMAQHGAALQAQRSDALPEWRGQCRALAHHLARLCGEYPT